MSTDSPDHKIKEKQETTTTSKKKSSKSKGPVPYVEIGAEEAIKLDLDSEAYDCDPYLLIKLGKNEVRSKIVERTINPGKYIRFFCC